LSGVDFNSVEREIDNGLDPTYILVVYEGLTEAEITVLKMVQNQVQVHGDGRVTAQYPLERDRPAFPEKATAILSLEV
jgi:hypothetical protein